MNVDLLSIINSEDAKVDIDCQIDVPNISTKEGAKIQGYAKNINGSIKVYLKISTVLNVNCDRCCDEMSVPMEVVFNENVGEDDLQLNGTMLDLGDIAEKTIFLNKKMQYFCKDDCKGICLKCGVNKNYETCNCQDEVVIDEKFADILKHFSS